MLSPLWRVAISSRNVLLYSRDVLEHNAKHTFASLNALFISSRGWFGIDEGGDWLPAGANDDVQHPCHPDLQSPLIFSTDIYQTCSLRHPSPPGWREGFTAPPICSNDTQYTPQVNYLGTLAHHSRLRRLYLHHNSSPNSPTGPTSVAVRPPRHAVQSRPVRQPIVRQLLFPTPRPAPITPLFTPASKAAARAPQQHPPFGGGHRACASVADQGRPAAKPGARLSLSQARNVPVEARKASGGSPDGAIHPPAPGTTGAGAESGVAEPPPTSPRTVPPLPPLEDAATPAPPAATPQASVPTPRTTATATSTATVTAASTDATAVTGAPGVPADFGATSNVSTEAALAPAAAPAAAAPAAAAAAAAAARVSGAAAVVAGAAAAEGSRRRDRAPDPRRLMSRIKEAASLQALAIVVHRITSNPDLASNTLLLVAALSKLARTATDTAPPSAAVAAADVSSTTPPGPREELGSRPGVVLCELLPSVAAVVAKMRVGELASCAWSLGKLRSVWASSTGPLAVAAGQTADAIAERLALDWAQNASSSPSSSSSPYPSSPSTSSSSSSSATAAAAPLPLKWYIDGSSCPSPEGSTQGGRGGGRRTAAGVPEPAAPAPLWSQAGSQDVANLAWGLARCGRGSVYDGAGAGVYDGAWQWLGSTACDVLWSGQAREVANLTWAFATAGRPEPQVFDNLLMVLASNPRGPEVVRQLREEECTAVVWALATALGRLQGKSAAVAAEGAAGEDADYIPPPVQPVARVAKEEEGEGDDGGGNGAAGWQARCRTAGMSTAGTLRGQELARGLQRLGQRAADLAVNGKLTGRQTSSLLWSLVVLQRATGTAQDGACLQALARRAALTARYMDGQALGNTAWALGKLRFHRGGALEALCAAAVSSLERPPSQQRRGALTAAAAAAATETSAPLTTTGPLGQLGTLSQRDVLGQLGTLSQRDVIQLLWACARLRHVDERLVAAAQARLLPEVPSMTPWELTTLAFALAALDSRTTAPATFSAVCKRSQQLLPPLQRTSSGSFDEQRQEQQQQQQREQPQGRQQDGHQHGHMDREGEQRGAVLNAPQLAALVSALGRVEHYDSGLMDEACERLRTRLAGLQPWEVCGVVSALGQLEHAHSGLLAAVEEAVVYDIRPYSPSDLASLLYGFASMGTRAERLFMRAAAVLQRRLSSLEPEAVTRLAESFAVLSLPDDDLFESIAALAMRRNQLFSQQQVERLALAFRSLGYQDSDELLRAWRAGGRES